jgi:hypothetical protein
VYRFVWLHGDRYLIIKQTLLAATFTALWGGCASNPVDEHAKHQAELLEKRMDAMEEVLDEAPDWFLNPPKATDAGVYGTGMSSGRNLQFTLNKAKLQAEFNLAKMYGQAISGQERSYISDNGASSGLREDNSQVIDKLIAEQDISGYEQIDSKTILENGAYNTYVLLFYPYDNTNRMKEGKRQALAKEEASAAYRTLNKRVETRQKAQEARERAQQEHEVRLLEAEAKIRQAEAGVSPNGAAGGQ